MWTLKHVGIVEHAVIEWGTSAGTCTDRSCGAEAQLHARRRGDASFLRAADPPSLPPRVVGPEQGGRIAIPRILATPAARHSKQASRQRTRACAWLSAALRRPTARALRAYAEHPPSSSIRATLDPTPLLPTHTPNTRNAIAKVVPS